MILEEFAIGYQNNVHEMGSMSCLTLDNIIDMEKSVWIRVTILTIIIMMLGALTSVYEGYPKVYTQ